MRNAINVIILICLIWAPVQSQKSPGYGDNAFPYPVPVPAGTVARQPLVIGSGQIPIVTMTPRDGPGPGQAVVAVSGIHELDVRAVNESGNSPVVMGNPLYFVDGDSPPISKKSTGVLFGYAVENLPSGTTGKIEVVMAAKLAL